MFQICSFTENQQRKYGENLFKMSTFSAMKSYLFKTLPYSRNVNAPSRLKFPVPVNIFSILNRRGKKVIHTYSQFSVYISSGQCENKSRIPEFLFYPLKNVHNMCITVNNPVNRVKNSLKYRIFSQDVQKGKRTLYSHSQYKNFSPFQAPDAVLIERDIIRRNVEMVRTCKVIPFQTYQKQEG